MPCHQVALIKMIVINSNHHTQSMRIMTYTIAFIEAIFVDGFMVYKKIPNGCTSFKVERRRQMHSSIKVLESCVKVAFRMIVPTPNAMILPTDSYNQRRNPWSSATIALVIQLARAHFFLKCFVLSGINPISKIKWLTIV